MKTIDMAKLGRPHPARTSELYFVDLEHGKEVAEKSGFSERVLAFGEVDLVLREELMSAVSVGDSFVKGMFGPASRKVGLEKFANLVRVNGRRLEDEAGRYVSYGDRLGMRCVNWLVDERNRVKRAEKAKARAERPEVWSGAVKFYVPEIGTVVRLDEAWTFRLYDERRNEQLLGQLGMKVGRWDRDPKHVEVVVEAGAEMSVNRVYIRQGASDYSSLTFYLKPGAKVSKDGKEFVTKGKTRFWAKLSDVNRMRVRIDTGSLAEG